MSRNDQELIAPLEKHKFNTDNLVTWMESNEIAVSYTHLTLPTKLTV